MTRRFAWIALALVVAVGGWWLLRSGGERDRLPLDAKVESRIEGTTNSVLRAPDGSAPSRDVVEGAVTDDAESVTFAAPPAEAASADAPAVVLRGRATFRHG
jgi:hypothetical protein